MNKYLIPICDIEAGSCWIHIITAKSLKECKEKFIEYILEYYDFEDEINDTMNYSEFVNILDQEKNIIIGSIKDIDEL